MANECDLFSKRRTHLIRGITPIKLLLCLYAVGIREQILGDLVMGEMEEGVMGVAVRRLTRRNHVLLNLCT